LDQIDSIISQANEQLGGLWRLPNRKELESLVCKDCKKIKKINKKSSFFLKIIFFSNFSFSLYFFYY